MLPSPIRLDLRSYPGFFTDPQVIRTPHLTIFIQTKLVTSLHAAVLVKKAFGGAVERAKIRRILRSTLIALWKESPALFSHPSAIAVLPRRPQVSQKQYVDELRGALERLPLS